jgi:hypothetical protein
MTKSDRAALQVAAVVGAVLGGVTGYLLSNLVESGGWLKILIWALIGRPGLSRLRARPRRIGQNNKSIDLLKQGPRPTFFNAAQNVCFWHKADIPISLSNVRFRVNS